MSGERNWKRFDDEGCPKWIQLVFVWKLWGMIRHWIEKAKLVFFWLESWRRVYFIKLLKNIWTLWTISYKFCQFCLFFQQTHFWRQKRRKGWHRRQEKRKGWQRMHEAGKCLQSCRPHCPWDYSWMFHWPVRAVEVKRTYSRFSNPKNVGCLFPIVKCDTSTESYFPCLINGWKWWKLSKKKCLAFSISYMKGLRWHLCGDGWYYGG